MSPLEFLTPWKGDEGLNWRRWDRGSGDSKRGHVRMDRALSLWTWELREGGTKSKPCLSLLSPPTAVLMATLTLGRLEAASGEPEIAALASFEGWRKVPQYGLKAPSRPFARLLALSYLLFQERLTGWHLCSSDTALRKAASSIQPSEKHQREKAPRKGNLPGAESAPLCSPVDSVDPPGGIVLTSGSSLRGDLPQGRGDLWSPCGGLAGKWGWCWVSSQRWPARGADETTLP